MKNWEELYEKYQSGEMEQKYNELKAKVEKDEVQTTQKDGVEYVTKRELTEEEYKEFKSMKNFDRIKENIPKVTNIKEIKEKYKVAYQEMEVEKDRRKTLEAQKEITKQLENDIKKNLDIRTALTPYLYATDISDSKREEVKKTLGAINDRIEDLESKYKVSVESFSLENSLKTKYSELSDQELRKNMRKTAIKVSKCDIVAGELMEGKDWNTIEYKLDNWNKYMDKNKIVSELANNKSKQKQQPIEQVEKIEKEETKQEKQNEQPRIEKQPVEQFEKPEKEAIKQQVKNENEFIPGQINGEPIRTPQQKQRELEEQDFIQDVIKKKENKPAVVPEFLTNHPRIAKIVNWFRNIHPIEAIKSRIAKMDEDKKEIEENKAKLREVVENEKALSQKERPEVVRNEKNRIEEEKDANEFKTYIRQIAEKGVEGMKAEKMQNLKQAAYERETEKFGEEYAKKSYVPKKEQQNNSDER